MKVHESNVSSSASAGVQAPPRTAPASGGSTGSASDAQASDGVHLSELVRTLRSLAADSPEHQARVDRLARSVANGSYQVDTRGTASKIVDDAIQRS